MEKKLTAQEITELAKRHVPTTPTIGYKCFQPGNSPEELTEIRNYLRATEDLVSFKKIQKLGSLSEANWCPGIEKAEVTHQVGSYWTSMGHTENKKLYLHPEEALYLLEMGVLELKYNGLPISVIRAYSTLLEPSTSVTEDCYRVYSQLQSDGYKVMRHVQSNKLTKYEKQLQIHKAGIKVKIHNTNNETDESAKLTESQNLEPETQKVENLERIFPVNVNEENESNLEKLKIFKLHKCNEKSNLSVHYDVFLASDGKSSFKKSHLQLPKVRCVVHRGTDPMPDLKDIHSLSQQYQDDVPIIHAVVFPEFITFYSITPVSAPICT